MTMRTVMQFFLLSLLTTSVSGLAMAASTPNTTPTTSNTPAQTAAPTSQYLQNYKFEQQFCPLATELTKDADLIWHGPNHWKAYSQSFANEVGGFIGAQWTGVNVGKVFCIYKAKDKVTFPITLERNVIIPSPTGGLWGPNQAGRKNCHSTEVTDCPFLIELPKEQYQDIYQSIDFFKEKSDTTSTTTP